MNEFRNEKNIQRKREREILAMEEKWRERGEEKKKWREMREERK